MSPRRAGYRPLPGVCLAAALGSFSLCGQSLGQFAMVDQTRSITVAAGYADGTLGTLPQSSDTNSVTGSYNNALSSVLPNTTVTAPVDDSAIVAYNSSAGQISMVSNSMFTANGSAGSAAGYTPIAGPGWEVKAQSQSSYNVDFTVSSPTPFNLSGSITGSDEYHPGPLETIATNVTLSSSASINPLYSVSFGPGFDTDSSFSDPVSYSALLEPGQTYTLNAQASAEAFKVGNGYLYAPASAGFAFTASVPEPANLALLPVTALLLWRPGRRMVADVAGYVWA